MKRSIDYRLDIDGLRAISVIIVLLFHSGFTSFSGGYIGVDVFFVISGYLITSILLNDLDSFKFDIKMFYLRRIKRIFPSLFIVKFIVIITGALIYDPRIFEEIGKSVISSSLFLSNIFFWKTSGYFESNVYMKPLIHTWSLSVEEQFYLFFPLFLIFIYKFYKEKLVILITIILLLSFTLNLFGTIIYPSATYYLTFTRGWELLVGSILSLKLFPEIQNKIGKNILFILGIFIICICSTLFNESSTYPGYNAVFPVLGASLIIHNGIDNNVSLQDLLKSRFLVFIGRISYPLYLWNWPVVSFYKSFKTTTWSNFDGIIMIFITFVLALITYKYVELPFKRSRIELKIIAISFLLMVSTIIAGTIIVYTKGMPNRVNTEISKIVNDVSSDEYWIAQNDWENINATNFFKTTPPVIGTKKTSPSFALIGDSHARSLVPAFAKLAEIYNFSGYAITMSSTPPLLGINIKSSVNDNSINENDYNYSVLKFLRRNKKIKTVILTARWGGYVNGNWKEKKESPGFSIFYDENFNRIENKIALELGLNSLIDSLELMKKKIVILTDVPEIGYDVPSVFWSCSILPKLLNFNSIRPTIKEYNQRENNVNLILEKISNEYNVKLIHLEYFMFDKGGLAIIKNNEKLLYRDNNHLSKNGSLFLIPALKKVF